MSAVTLPGTAPLAPLRKTLSQAHGCLAIFAFPLYSSNWQLLSLWYFAPGQETARRVLKSTSGWLAEGVPRELLQLLWHGAAGLFPAWVKHIASSKEEAHKGKMSFASSGTHLLNQAQRVAFFVYVILAACFGSVERKEKKNTKKTKITLPYNFPLSTGIGFDSS